MSTKVIRTTKEMQNWRKAQGSSSVGFVPTMGALHEGHAQLLQVCQRENDLAVLCIFVNPTQFNDKQDFEKYPMTWEADFQVAEKNKVDVIFAPTYPELYPDQYTYKLSESDFSLDLCGKNRPGHFDGVLTVVMKLLNLVQPVKAYFGEKDFQQLGLIRGMAEAFFLNCEIIAVPTVRESDGLALSSRNTRLTALEREAAPLIYKAISSSATNLQASEKLEAAGFRVDYVKDLRGRRFVAATLGNVRLIDNVEL